MSSLEQSSGNLREGGLAPGLVLVKARRTDMFSESLLPSGAKHTARQFSGLLRGPLLRCSHENNHWFFGAKRKRQPAPSFRLWLQACYDRISSCPDHFRGMPKVQRQQDVSRRRVCPFQVAHQIVQHDSRQPDPAPSHGDITRAFARALCRVVVLACR